MKRRRFWLWALVAIVVVAAVAFTSRVRPVANELTASYDPADGYRLANLDDESNGDGLFVILSFSGGGTRAAALSYGALRKLADTTIVWDGEERRLLDEVDIISSISGGSFTAAYYGLFGDRIFEDYEERFLKLDVESALAGRLIRPSNLYRLASPYYSRIDMAADFYDQEVFEGATFADLESSGRRPFITINATDMTLGGRFTFIQEQFDLLCSDLSALPIARAVASSSAFPGLLSPVTLHNYAGSCNFEEPRWVSLALEDVDLNPRRFSNAQSWRSYQSGERPFVHLVDGGLADNIGLRGPIWALSSNDPGWSVLRRMRKIRKLVVIAVNAKTAPAIQWDQRESTPGLKDVLGLVSSAPMDNYSFETVEMVKDLISRLGQDARSRADCEAFLESACPAASLPGTAPPQVDYYRVRVHFDALRNDEERRYFQTLPTSFKLEAEQVDRLKKIAGTLLDESASFQKLLDDLSRDPDA